MRTKDRKKNIYTIIFVIIIFIVIFMLNKKYILKNENILGESIDKKTESDLIKIQAIEKNEELQETKQNEKEQNMLQNEQEKNVIQNHISKDVKDSIITSYKGYPVIAKLEIPEIELETYVISEYSEKALGISVTKFYGGQPNDVGNFCIAGHNYITKNMFHNLKKVSVGNTIFLTDLENDRQTYIIYSKETVEPYETQCLSQKTNGKVELTLITCTADSSKRIIVKAVKV